MRILLTIMLPMFLAALFPVVLVAGTIEGRVVDADQALSGVVVVAYKTLDFSAEPISRSKPSDSEGAFRLELPAGSYALFGWNAGANRFAFCGRNPVQLGDKTIWAGLQAVKVDSARALVYDDEYSAAIEGQVLHEGVPVAGAYVHLYLDVVEDLKGLGYRLSLPTGDDGYFRFDGLPESNYFLVARFRQNGQRVGPVQEGDLFGIYSGNPLTARAGTVQQVKLRTVAKLKGAAESETRSTAHGPVLKGVVLGHEGRGVAGVHVFAYVDRVIGHQRPAAISSPTTSDGRFVVNLPEPGTYYVGAREAYGDSPAPEELFGMYDESADHGLTLKEGQVMGGIRIVVEPIALFLDP
jgi:hypothetical protein